MLKKSLIAKTDPKANDKQIAVIGDVRITYITSRLIRVESFGSFTDLASKTVWNRNFPCDGFKAEKRVSQLPLKLRTQFLSLKTACLTAFVLKTAAE